MWQTFRQYKTSLDFELVKAEVLENDDVFKFTSDEKQLSFRLREFPDNPLQLTPINDLLKIHGLKPYRFLRDLRITKSMALNLRKRCPDGIDFKLDKEVISHYDRNETVERLESMLHWRECECKLLRNGGEPRYQTFLNAVGRLYENNENRRLEVC